MLNICGKEAVRFYVLVTAVIQAGSELNRMLIILLPVVLRYGETSLKDPGVSDILARVSCHRSRLPKRFPGFLGLLQVL
jgi:hypothetical protein